MSHRHGDHMGGLSYLLKVNPKVKIYAPKETFGVYGRLAQHVLSQGLGSPTEQQSYSGAPPETMRFGSAWPEPIFNSWTKPWRSRRIWF